MTTTQDPTFRQSPTEIVKDGNRWFAITECADLDPESGRWEPFCSIVELASE